MAEPAIAEPPKPTPAAPEPPKPTPKSEPKPDEVSAKAFMSVFARDIGVQLGEPDLKKIEQPKPAEPAPAAPIVPDIEGLPMSEIAKRKREMASAPTPTPAPAAKEPPKPAASAPSAPVQPPSQPKGAGTSLPPAPTPAGAPTPAPPPVRETPPAPPAKPDQPDIEATLLPEEREEIAFDRLAEKHLPDKKGMAAKRLAFFQKLNDYVAQHPDLTPDSDELTSFIAKHKPTYTDAERRKIERAALKEEVLEEAKKSVEAPLAEAQKKIRELETIPAIQARVEDFEVDLTAALPEDLRKAALEKDLDDLDEDFPLEAPIARRVYDSTLIAADEFLQLARAVKPYDPQNGTHQWLVQFINAQGDIFVEQGGDAKTRNGKQFVPRSQYVGDPKTWTFSDDEILKMLSANAKMNIDTMIAQEVARNEKINSKRRPAAPTENPKQETPSPRMPTTPALGAATPGQNEQPLTGFFRSLVGDGKPT